MKKIILQSFLASFLLFLFNYYVLNMELFYTIVFFVIVTEIYFLLFRMLDLIIIEKDKDMLWFVFMTAEVILTIEFSEVIFAGYASRLNLCLCAISFLSIIVTCFIGKIIMNKKEPEDELEND